MRADVREERYRRGNRARWEKNIFLAISDVSAWGWLSGAMVMGTVGRRGLVDAWEMLGRCMRDGEEIDERSFGRGV
jgi:hypothetical protein